MLNALALIATLSLTAAGAPPPRLAGIDHATPGGTSGLVHKVGVFGTADRRTESQFAQENGRSVGQVRSRYAATGLLTCKSGKLTANMTLRNDLITTAAHAFFDTDTCKRIAWPQSCTFTIRVGGKVHVSRVRRLESIGYRCPRLPSPADDWAVLRLERRVPGIAPYAIAGSKVEEGQAVTSVQAISNDFFDRGGERLARAKALGRCNVRKLYGSNQRAPFLFGSDCDLAGGGSGGAIVDDRRGTPVLLGINEGTDESNEAENAAVENGTPNSGLFVPGRWGAYHVPVAGSFSNAIRKAAQPTHPKRQRPHRHTARSRD